MRVHGVHERPEDHEVDPRITAGRMDNGRASSFTPAEQELLLKQYEGLKASIRQKGNTSAAKKERERAWQTIADRLNATNLSGQKRTWQQVKTKYKNILQSAVKKKSYHGDTGGGPPPQDLIPAEELVIDLTKGRPVMDSVLAADHCSFIQVSGDRVVLLEPPEDDPEEGMSAAVECVSADEETLSLESRRLEDLETAPPPKEAGNINSQTIRTLHAKHLQKQTELAQLQIQREKRNLEAIELDLRIKRRTLRKLDLEIQKLERETES